MTLRWHTPLWTVFIAVIFLTGSLGSSCAFSLGKEIGSCFSGGCDVVWGLNQRIDGGIRSKSEAMIDPVKQAFLEIMNELFDKKLNPLVDKINEAAASRLAQMNAIVQDAEKGIDQVIEHAANQMLVVGDKITNDIKQRVIDETFERADALIVNVSAQIQQVIDDVDCKIDGQRAKLEEWVRAQFALFPHPFSRCYVDYGFRWSVPGSDDYLSTYRIRQCELVEQLDASKTVFQIKDNYGRLSLLSRRFKCMAQADVATSIITRDSVSYSLRYEMWRLASKSR